MPPMICGIAFTIVVMMVGNACISATRRSMPDLNDNRYAFHKRRYQAVNNLRDCLHDRRYDLRQRLYE
jgi:hypothetical protein